MGTLEEVEEAANTIYQTGNKNLIILHCTSNYPTRLEDVNLEAMNTISKNFGTLKGYSDHTEGILIPKMACLLGAKVIEKHYTYDKNAPGPDHKASLEPEELKEMVKEIRRIDKLSQEKKEKELNSIKEKELILGNGEKKPVEREIDVRNVVRKSIVAKKDLKKGTIIKVEDIITKRVGKGLEANKSNLLIGKKLKEDIKKDEIITLESITNLEEIK
jgi:N,N'-diacetyllegionaminate synthase